jgi:hypothetical protein
MANHHALFSSLYENPLAAGTLLAEAPLDAACHGRLVDYLRRDGLNDASDIALAAVASLPTIPPRALDLAPVASLPTIPPRVVSSIPSLPPRA